MSVKAALETLYTDTCDIYAFENVTEGVISKVVETVKYSAVPCRVSFSTVNQTGQTATVGYQEQLVKLFISPEINIAAGSKITVTRQGKSTDYWHSGKSAVYASHQEIVLDLEKELV